MSASQELQGRDLANYLYGTAMAVSNERVACVIRKAADEIVRLEDPKAHAGMEEILRLHLNSETSNIFFAETTKVLRKAGYLK